MKTEQDKTKTKQDYYYTPIRARDKRVKHRTKAKRWNNKGRDSNAYTQFS